jgi:sporulation protein YlmC with PRC-barrel domain
MIARVVGTTAALLLVASAALPADKSRPVRVAIQNHQFTSLRGMTVENNDGERLGTLTDFVLNVQSGRVEFGIIRSGGVGPFAKQKIVPSFCLSLSSVKAHTVALDVNDTRWSKAPGFDPKNLKDLNSPARKTQIAEFYHFTGDIAEKERYSVKTLSATGRRPNGSAGENLVLASDLMGCQMLCANRHPMGKICDVLIDTTQRMDKYVIFSSRGFLKSGNCYAVPLSDIQKFDHKTGLILPIDVDFAAAPPFDWTRPAAPGIYSYDLKARR